MKDNFIIINFMSITRFRKTKNYKITEKPNLDHHSERLEHQREDIQVTSEKRQITQRQLE